MTDYPKPALTVDAVVLAGEGTDTRLLVIQRGNVPFEGDWAFPGGFVDPYELPLTAVRRELFEETGLELDLTRFAPLKLRSRKGRDPRGWTSSQPFLFWLPRTCAVRAGDDARQAVWRPLSQIKRLAFDHGSILCEALGVFWEQMPVHEPVFRGIKPYGTPSPLEHPIFYGGSFNPWHQGHGACVDLCPHKNRLIIVPDSNPFKSGPANFCYWEHYQALVRQMNGNPHQVFPGWCGSELPNPTVNWLPQVDAEHKSLLMGDDSLASLPRWLEAARLVRAVDQFFVAPRNAAEEDILRARAWITEHHPKCVIHFLKDHEYKHLSSTELRNRSEGNE